MANPTIRIHDVSTGEIIDRPMTDAEYEDFLNPQSVFPLTNNE
jgi:hypothetical protein